MINRYKLFYYDFDKKNDLYQKTIPKCEVSNDGDWVYFKDAYFWRNSDPREYFNKRGQIIIQRPFCEGQNSVGTATVETKQGYNIFMSFEDHKLIDVDQKWDFTWKWIEQQRLV